MKREQNSRVLTINPMIKFEETLFRLVLSKEEILKITVGNTSTWKLKGIEFHVEACDLFVKN